MTPATAKVMRQLRGLVGICFAFCLLPIVFVLKILLGVKAAMLDEDYEIRGALAECIANFRVIWNQPDQSGMVHASNGLGAISDSGQDFTNSEHMQGDQPVIRMALLLAHKQGLGARFWARSALPSIEEIEAELGPDLLKQARDLVDYRPSNFST